MFKAEYDGDDQIKKDIKEQLLIKLIITIQNGV